MSTAQATRAAVLTPVTDEIHVPNVGYELGTSDLAALKRDL